MFKNRFILILAALSMLLVTLAVSRPFSKPPKTVDLARPPRALFVPVTGARDKPYIMDSATRSYIAWGEALKAKGKAEGSALSAYIANVKNSECQADISSDVNLDSATRSYIALGEALEAARNAKALDSATRSYIAWGQALQAQGLMCR